MLFIFLNLFFPSFRAQPAGRTGTGKLNDVLSIERFVHRYLDLFDNNYNI